MPRSRAQRKAARLSVPTVAPSADLAAPLCVYTHACVAAQRRAERFGTEYVPPSIFSVEGITQEQAKRLLMQRSEGVATGFDITAESEAEKRSARAARFGLQAPFKLEEAPARALGLTDEEIRLRAERRARAARFGVPDPLDLQVAQAAAAALGDDDVPTSGAEVRGNALHLRCSAGYIPAGTVDLIKYFGDLSPTFVEWLNGFRANVLFADEFTAKRALSTFAEPIPTAPGVPTVHESWRVCLKPLVKLRTDKYATAGTEVTVFLRPATVMDDKAHAPPTTGARTHGTYSMHGEFAARRQLTDVAMDEDDAAAPQPEFAVTKRVAETLRHAATSLAGAKRRAAEAGNLGEELVDTIDSEGNDEGEEELRANAASGLPPAPASLLGSADSQPRAAPKKRVVRARRFAMQRQPVSAAPPAEVHASGEATSAPMAASVQ